MNWQDMTYYTIETEDGGEWTPTTGVYLSRESANEAAQLYISMYGERRVVVLRDEGRSWYGSLQGFKACVRRDPQGTWSVYVGVPPTHPTYEMDSADVESVLLRPGDDELFMCRTLEVNDPLYSTFEGLRVFGWRPKYHGYQCIPQLDYELFNGDMSVEYVTRAMAQEMLLRAVENLKLA